MSYKLVIALIQNCPKIENKWICTCTFHNQYIDTKVLKNEMCKNECVGYMGYQIKYTSFHMFHGTSIFALFSLIPNNKTNVSGVSF